MDVCTTREAARLLGISVTTVQQMVESGQLEAWKTGGGHRRIPLRAVQDLLGQQERVEERRLVRPEDLRLRVLVVEDDELMRELITRQLGRWSLPLDVTMCASGYEALIEISRQPTDIVFADLMMKGIDGYEVIQTILRQKDLASVRLAILSGIDDQALAARGGVPPGVTFFRKPVNFDELKGFVRACLADAQRRAGA